VQSASAFQSVKLILATNGAKGHVKQITPVRIALVPLPTKCKLSLGFEIIESFENEDGSWAVSRWPLIGKNNVISVSPGKPAAYFVYHEPLLHSHSGRSRVTSEGTWLH
jgi:hypothetical protein